MMNTFISYTKYCSYCIKTNHGSDNIKAIIGQSYPDSTHHEDHNLHTHLLYVDLHTNTGSLKALMVMLWNSEIPVMKEDCEFLLESAWKSSFSFKDLDVPDAQIRTGIIQ